MPKRSLDVANMGHVTKAPDRANRKTERSHEENQERAYIAASRRADRSIEARVQSARMASEIHKKRTGKAFRITEEIVTKEEMYEEEEDEFPRSYRILGPHMQTASAEMNSRVDAYLSNRVAMSQLLSATEADWRDNEINRTFAHFFPQADRQAQSISQRWSTPGFSIPRPQNNRMPSSSEQSFEPTFQSVNYGQQGSHDERRQSRAAMSPTAEVKNEGPVSPPALTPSSHPETPQSGSTSVFANTMPPLMEGSAFTAELPAEAKMLMGGVGLDDTFNPAMYGDTQNWGAPTQSYSFDQPKFSSKEEEIDFGFGGDRYPESFEPVNWGPGYGTPTKNPVEEPSWDVFLNDNWNEQQSQQQQQQQ